MSQPSHFELGQQIARVAAIIEPIPARLDRIEEKWDEDINGLRFEIAELKQQRSHLVGIGVGIGTTVTFIAGLIATFGDRVFALLIGKGPA